MAGHSPTPWKLVDSAAIPGVIVADDGGHRIRVAEMCGSMSNPDIAADAAFIVHAVNLHDEMVEALREAELQIVYLHEKFAETGSGNTTLAKIRSVLSKSTPTQEGE